MKKILLLSNESPAAVEVERQLNTESQFDVIKFKGDFESVSDYQKTIGAVDGVISVLGPNDVDLAFDALFDAYYELMPAIERFIMVTVSGLDDEVQPPRTYEGVADQREFIKQQRYAAKIVDESEIPYTIIRAGRLISKTDSEWQLFKENEPMPNGEVSDKVLAKFIVSLVINNDHLNESVGILNK
ncbi:NAD(P)-binding oxidoreductase [Lentilactobacillus sp. Marseille-Q4993]|uniref:NAD(P)-binding oxidoreductase n=1 Tax=Lentilactobacillus sp. Marseille-Q4993 TaxID=3039492 RepID=UPI0024BD2A7C|nr:NAD(P)-binding oxidoreductase [Lentilactobacillus sp. Marseille-Q4993]